MNIKKALSRRDNVREQVNALVERLQEDSVVGEYLDNSYRGRYCGKYFGFASPTLKDLKHIQRFNSRDIEELNEKVNLVLSHLNLCYTPVHEQRVKAALIPCPPTEEGDKT